MATRMKQHDPCCTYTTGMFALGTGFVALCFLAIREFVGLGFSPAAVPCAELVFAFCYSSLLYVNPLEG